MDPHLVFAIASSAVLPFWLLLAVAPRWEWTGRIVHAAWLPLALAPVYLVALLSAGEAPEGAGFGSLEGVMLLFTDPNAVLAGWVHYLVFDLFVGAWQVRDSQRRGVPHWAVLPCLLATLMTGPVGLGLYLAIRAGMGRGFSLAEEAGAPA